MQSYKNDNLIEKDILLKKKGYSPMKKKHIFL